MNDIYRVRIARINYFANFMDLLAQEEKKYTMGWNPFFLNFIILMMKTQTEIKMYKSI